MGVLSSSGFQPILHYEVVERIGEGGMGMVYKARDRSLDRFVVLKVLPPLWVTDPEARARLAQEARCASIATHPNVVTIHALEQANGVDFIVMEWVDGKTLDQCIPTGGMPLRRAVNLATQVAAALAKAHEEGIVHRDLKPSNIMVTRDDRIKVVDFGLAWFLRNESRLHPDSHGPVLEASALGTRGYMSPEQAAGACVDQRSDVFSFGAVLYEMLTGTPFQPAPRSSQGKTGKPSLALPDSSPPALRRLVARCLEPSAEKRSLSMDCIWKELTRLDKRGGGRLMQSMRPNGVCSSESLSARSEPTRSKRFKAWIRLPRVLVGGFCLAASLAGWLMPRHLPAPPPLTSVVVAATPQSVPPSAASRVDSPIYASAVGLMREKKYEAAAELFGSVIRSEPSHPDALYNRAVCLQNLHRWREATDNFSEVLRRQPERLQALYNRAVCYMNLEKLPEAERDLTGVLQRTPSMEAYRNRAKLRYQLHNEAGARSDEEQARAMTSPH